MKVGIIGGGAAGMMAAITASETPENQVIIFERQSRVGRKLLATGNGRCNLSNQNVSSAHYHGSDPGFVQAALQALPVTQTLDRFRAAGLLTVTEPTGRVYPYSDQANSVVDVLRYALMRKNVEIRCGCEILSVKYTPDGFLLKTQEGSETVDRLIVAAGGAAGSKLGGGLSGYALLRSLGHHCTKLYPSLVQLKTGDPYVKSLRGVRANAEIMLCSGETLLAKSQGEVQFTDYGLSGPAIFDISRAAATAPKDSRVVLNLLPNMDSDALLSLLCIRISRTPLLPREELFTGLLHNRLGRVLLRCAGITGSDTVQTLSWEQLTGAVRLAHEFSLPLSGVMGMDCAQVTAGGICTEEFDPETLQSRCVPGLYAAGEILDIDGDCGGYNLQWAWSSGCLAGQLRTSDADNS